MTQPATLTITARTRIGFGCTTMAEQTPAGLRVAAPTFAAEFGTVRTIQDRARAYRRCVGADGGTFSRDGWWVRGRRVNAEDISDAIYDIVTCGKSSATVRVLD